MGAVAPPEPLNYQPPTEPWLTVLHEDPALLALDKPALLLTVPGKPAGHGDCLEARARARWRDSRIVHRLDRPTSGVVAMGRGPAAQAALGLQFERRTARKAYVARVAGRLSPSDGVIDAPVCGDWPNRPRQMVHFEHGKAAETAWRVLGREAHPDLPEGVTRVLLEPRTGRTHQLRLHLAWIGHPILGDEFYAPPAARAAAERLQLHAETLELAHPVSGEIVRLAAACPF